MQNPLDQTEVHLPGRLLAVETLMIMLLREHPDAGKILQATDASLAAAETKLAREGAHTPYALAMFAMARENLDAISTYVRPQD